MSQDAGAVTLRPTAKAAIEILARSLPAAAFGLFFLAFGVIARALVPVLCGGLFVAMALFFAIYKLGVRVRLRAGVLTYRSLVERHQVHVADITEVVPVNLTMVVGVIRRYKTRGRYFDVRSRGRSTGIWLNPHVYGDDAVTDLLSRLGHTPSEPERRDVDL